MTTPILTAKSNTLIFLLALLCCAGVYAQQGQTFGAPVFFGKSNASVKCDEKRSQFRMLDDRKSLSFLVVDPFLDVGRGGPPNASATCILEIPINEYSTTGRTIQVQIAATGTKEPQSEIRVSLKLGNQLHRIEYLRGRLLDAASSPEQLLRFRVPPNAIKGGKLRLELSGTARSLNSNDQAQLAFGIVSACFVESETPEVCGSPIDAPKN